MIKSGLKKLKQDKRDFNLGSIFGIETNLPKEFIVSGAEKLKIKNQYRTDYCSAYATTSASELQEKIELNPEFQFAYSKKISGDINKWGCDLRTVCKSFLKYGSLEQKILKEFKMPNDIRNWKNWNSKFLKFALKHKKKSYFSVDMSFENKFDLIKSALYKHNSAVISGINWKSKYTFKSILSLDKSRGFGHAFCFIGWKIIKGKEYLIIHNSLGKELGDKGLWYLPRNMEKELQYGNFIFIDMPSKKVKIMIKSKIRIDDNFFIKIYKLIIYFYENVF